MSVSAKQQMGMVTTETVSTGLDHGDATEAVAHNLNSGGVSTTTLTSTTTPPATKVYSDEIDLVAGAATIDLTSLTGPFSASVDFTGLKVQQIYIKAHAANTSHITLVEGVANPYFLFGITADRITVHAGTEVMFRMNEALADVAAGAKTIDASSADLDAKFDIHLVAG
jgi:hypothetical protein